MSLIRRGVNPFYVVLVLAAVAFTLTASAYGVMTVRGLKPASRTEPESELITYMRRNGTKIMLYEIGILALASGLAMATDRYWSPERTARSGDVTAGEHTNRRQSDLLPKE
ncbi:MAG: hypothetical protein RIS70_2662 [Planctomycetota bacterium]|jgi:hypothetical protein